MGFSGTSALAEVAGEHIRLQTLPRHLHLYCEASMTIYTNGKFGPSNVEEIADSAIKCTHLSKSQ